MPKVRADIIVRLLDGRGPQLAEPAIGQIEVNFLAEPPFETDPKAIADQQHPNR